MIRRHRRHRDRSPAAPAAATDAELDELQELLDRANPHPGPLQRPSSEHVARMMAVVRYEMVRRGRRRRKSLVAGLALAVSAGGGVVAWAITHRPADNPLMVACHAEPRLDSSVIGVAGDGSSAVEQCRALWVRGDFGELGFEGEPALIGCARPGGVAAVFPADDPSICADLGLDVLDLQVSNEQQRLIGFHDAVADRARELGCIDAERLRQIVEEELQRHDLSDWSVVTDAASAGPDLVCAVPTFEPVEQRVLINFVPDLWAEPPASTDPNQEDTQQ